ncbi:cytochrome c oxidase accessory protein CcoG [Motilimonas cestriensis]|uniref:Cytochrome c oxidase accessory protein CcoG n=1 Tax=Motilimonas cestriensis TaxID=2742685 RepID=A0ABS8WDM5_9GAMM|nr:cytochrome c oxidase accessory protein CcoG [Motilimonas cestriensis]MCE2596590.1 cytochrome c oxidase accessory protein CcoG [Motilimonas cestriensis]
MDRKIDVKDISDKVKPGRKTHKASVDRFDPSSTIYVRSVKGVYQRLRKFMGWFLLLLFIVLPLIPWDGHQAILFDIENNRYHIFNLTIFPQDLTLLAWIFIIAAFGLFFFTTYLGRVWCGYTCPQTVWTFIFIWFEELFEGKANKRRKLDESPWNGNKIWRKAAKHACWWLVALMTGLAFASYFVPVYELYTSFFTLSASFALTFWVLFFSTCTYINAGWMRAIVCTHMCPYARFQSAMFDKDTFIVGYDAKRGESRGPRSRKADPKELGLGDCIDCDLCVQVCPTGIDIRDGLQYECINCGACIDACDQTMERMGYEKGLIAYTTEHKLTGAKTDILRPKIIGYGVVLSLMCGLFVWNLLTIKAIGFEVLRDRNALYRETNEGLVENAYTFKIINKTMEEQEYNLSVTGLPEPVWSGPTAIRVAPGEVFTQPVSIAVDPYELDKSILTIQFTVQDTDSDEQIQQESRFFSGGR